MAREDEQANRKEYIQNLSELLEFTSDKATNEQFKKIQDFSEYLTSEYTGDNFFALSELFNKDLNVVYKLFDTLKTFSTTNDIPIVLTFRNLMLISEVQVKSLDNIFTSQDLDEDLNELFRNLNPNAKKHLLEMLSILGLKNITQKASNYRSFKDYFDSRLMEVVEHSENLPINKSDAIVMQTVLYDSYEEAKEQISEDIENASLPLSKYNPQTMNVIRELSEESIIFEDIFLNQSTLSQMNADNHFLKHLLDDDMQTTPNGNVIFSGYTKALIMGHTQKAISLSVDKDKALIELKKGIEVFNKYNNAEAIQLIKTTEALITVVEQQKYSNMIPFKAMAKVMGITKNEAKQYAKQLSTFYSIHNNTFEKYFENLKVYKSSDYTS